MNIRLRRSIVLISFLLSMTQITIAQSHTTLTSSNPEDGAVVQALPTSFELTFDEKLLTLKNREVNSITARDGNKNLVELGEVEVSGNRISVAILEKNAIEGLYKVYYRVVSRDGHPISGYFSFSVGSSNAETLTVEPKPSATHQNHSGEFFLRHWEHFGLGFIGVMAILVWWLILRRRKET